MVDNETLNKAREQFLKSVVGLYKQGVLTKEQVLKMMDKQDFDIPPEEKEVFIQKVRTLLG